MTALFPTTNVILKPSLRVKGPAYFDGFLVKYFWEHQSLNGSQSSGLLMVFGHLSRLFHNCTLSFVKIWVFHSLCIPERWHPLQVLCLEITLGKKMSFPLFHAQTLSLHKHELYIDPEGIFLLFHLMLERSYCWDTNTPPRMENVPNKTSIGTHYKTAPKLQLEIRSKFNAPITITLWMNPPG